MDQILQEIHGHPAVNGIIIWSAWSPSGCYRMCLTDNNFRNLATGNVVDKFMKGLAHEGLQVTTDSNGFFTASLYHGDYEGEISDGTIEDNTLTASRFSVTPESKNRSLKINFK